MVEGNKDTSSSPDPLRAFEEKVENAERAVFAWAFLVRPDDPLSYRTLLKNMGKVWQMTRGAVGLTREETASRAGISDDDLVLFEAGLVDPQDYPDGLLEKLSQAIGDPDILKVHKELFGPKDEEN